LPFIHQNAESADFAEFAEQGLFCVCCVDRHPPETGGKNAISSPSPTT
jgi:hypothetical protein